MDSTVPTNTVQVPNTTGTVTDGSVNTGFIRVTSGYIYRTGKLWALAGWPFAWLECWMDRPRTHVWRGVGWGVGCEHNPFGHPDAGWLASTLIYIGPICRKSLNRDCNTYCSMYFETSIDHYRLKLIFVNEPELILLTNLYSYIFYF